MNPSRFAIYLNPIRWKRSVLIGVLAVGALSWILFFDTYSLLTRYQLSSQEKELSREIERLELEIQRLEGEIRRLESDPSVLERIAREEYGMRKPGETVYNIEP
jgi:cell division protein FtsB